MNRPAYSIVIPVYQRLLGFDEALRSALDVAGCGEIIVIDDGSSHREFEAMCAQSRDDCDGLRRELESQGADKVTYRPPDDPY